VSTISAHPITVEQYERFEGYPGLRDELINGRIVMNPQPKPLHQHVLLNIMDILRRCVWEGTEFVVNTNSNIKFPALNSMPAPDVFIVSKKAWVEAIEANQYLSSLPFLVVEILSESNRQKHIDQKIQVYLDAGVPEVWVVDPKERVVGVHRRDFSGESFFNRNDLNFDEFWKMP